MQLKLSNSAKLKEINQNYIYDTLEFLLSNNQFFGIVCETSYAEFNPPLPTSLMDTFQDRVLFMIAEYSFESAILEEDLFSFEAGFGRENFGSTVNLPLLAIQEIIVENRPIAINFFLPIKQEKKIQNSMEKLLQNPQNQKLLKKKK
jgi:uncharacterized protein YpbB